ncbi:MAG TPA: ATP-binding protein [Rubrivivax sp.]|nr:ATP-binding protein [Rubrivivax sp.]
MDSEQRVLLHVATSKDATLASSVLARAGVDSYACVSTQQLVDELTAGAGAMMIAEEMMADAAREQLALALHAQPTWSDVPVLVLARQGANSRAVRLMMEGFPNLTVIERPVRVASMISTVRSALRARRRQYEVRGLLEGLREADQRKTEFLATLAHELRNPLAPLRTALTLLARASMARESSRYVALMDRQVDHMVRLVDDLMEVSRITRGKIDLQLKPLSVRDAIGDAIELSKPFLEGAGHQLTLVLPQEELVLRGDRVRLNQVFANLLNNAAKYTRPGGQIVLEARRERSEVLVSVADSGAGLAPDMLESIFDMFVQVSDSAKAAQGGLGIGLTLVKTLVELHGGSVAASSPGPGLGSTFTVRLPLINQEEPGTAGDVAASPGQLAPQPLGQRAVLVVDDNRDAAESLAELLRIEGATVYTAHSGEEALAVAAQRPLDAAVLDIGMPGMDGCELARRLRADPSRKRGGLQLIALTGWGQQDDQRRVVDAGFDHHLLKPAGADQLTALLCAPRAARA